MKTLVALSLLTAILCGCTSIDTDVECDQSRCQSSLVSLPISSDAVSINNGVIYSLPVQDVELTIENKLVTKEKLLKEKKELVDSAGKVEGEIKALKIEKANIETFLAKLPPDKESLKKKKSDELMSATINIGVKEESLAKINKKIAEKEMEINKLKLDPEKNYKFTATIKALEPYPDSKASLSAIIQDSSSSSETIEIKTTASGLLSGGIGNSRGNIDEIFISLAGAIGAFKGVNQIDNYPAEIMSLTTQKSTPPQVTDTEKCIQNEFKKVFRLIPHSTSKSLLSEVNDYFLANKYCFKASTDNENIFNAGYKATLDARKKTYIDGLVYPRQSTLKISLCETEKINNLAPKLECKNDESIVKDILTVSVIAPQKLGVLKMKQGFFADNSYEYEFSNGLLTRFKSDKGNEFVSFFGMFPEIAKAIVSIPAEIIQLKFDLSDKEKAYYEAQTEILKQKIKYDYYLNNPSTVYSEDSSDSSEK
ncbi:hypothetical protein ACO1HB_09995 [Alteromonas macleodii]|uniref:hypothetical protein n=1 Tax=Alteromonas macleodii TaxID=28108 RepID=UPI003BF7A94C